MADLYIFSPKHDEATWRIDPRDFARALKTRWPDAQIHEVTNPSDGAALTFELKLIGPVNGEFKRTGRLMIIDYVMRNDDLGEVVIWYRGLVPAAEDLAMVNESGDIVELTPGMTVAEFVQKIR